MKIVLFHKNCFDGLFSAFSYWKKFGAKDTIFIDVNYKPIQDMEPMEALNYIFDTHIKNPCSLNPAPYIFKDNKVTLEDMKEMELYILDYAFPVRHLLTYLSLFKSILTLDHHKTAIDEYRSYYPAIENESGWLKITPSINCEIIFSKNESGAKLSWIYFHGQHSEIPDYIELISDYDLWTFKLENTRKFDYGLKLEDLSSFNMIDTIMNSHKYGVISTGAKYEKMHLARIEKIVKANIINITGKIAGKEYKGGLINAYPDIRNEICDYAIKKLGYDFAIAYNIGYKADISCSVRSRKEVDSSVISLMYGGGGHANSSACRISLKEFNSIIKTKSIIVVKKRSFNFLKRLLEIFK